jgi:hypothetical protein
MALWEEFRDLEVVIADVGTERRSVAVSPEFTRVTTTVVLSGEGESDAGRT